ncbi:MAG TPA: winged helix-turn-helix domain-containing protein, partial [Amycolatopsis sp.]|nr:winged helix-turn-helix domain-containing protein [Amycolatopsis sp.]
MVAVIFRLLGAVEARVDASPVDLGPARQRCVLAALLVDANRLVSVDQLVGRVWADHPPYRARDTLYSYLSRLRHALPGGPPIERIAGGYVLRVPPDEVDLHYFRRLVTQARAAEDDKRAAALFEE